MYAKKHMLPNGDNDHIFHPLFKRCLFLYGISENEQKKNLDAKKEELCSFVSSLTIPIPPKIIAAPGIIIRQRGTTQTKAIAATPQSKEYKPNSH